MRYLPALGLLLLMFATSCKKIRENHIIKDVWTLNKVYLFGNEEENAMNEVLEGYNQPEGCCKYIMDFQDDGDVWGYYYRNDTLDYMIKGEWELQSKDKLYVNLDAYVNGVFDLERDDLHNYELHTDSNTGTLGPITLTGEMRLFVERRKP